MEHAQLLLSKWSSNPSSQERLEEALILCIAVLGTLGIIYFPKVEVLHGGLQRRLDAHHGVSLEQLFQLLQPARGLAAFGPK